MFDTHTRNTHTLLVNFRSEMLNLELSALWVFSPEDILFTLHAGGTDIEKVRDRIRERQNTVQYACPLCLNR